MIYLYLVVSLILIVAVKVAIDYKNAKTGGYSLIYGRDNFVRLTPNPGFQVYHFRWSKVNGRLDPYRPKKWGLGPGELAEDGTEMYARRMEYLADPVTYKKKRNLK